MSNEILPQNGAAEACHVSRGDAQKENNDAERAMVGKIAQLPFNAIRTAEAYYSLL